MSMRELCRQLLCIAACGLLFVAVSQRVQAAEETATQSAADAEQPQAVTVSNPALPVDHLKFLVKPLTRDELAVEAAAWRDLLKANVQEISDLQIGRQQPTEPGEQISAKEEAAPGRKIELAEQLRPLQNQRAQLIDRLNVVLDAWQAKGGEVEEYRQYIAAVSGLDLDVTDVARTWTALQGWATSEQGGQRWIWNIAKFLAILTAFYILSVVVGRVVQRASSRIRGASSLLKNFLSNFAKQTVLLVGIIVAVSALEVNISPLLAAIGGAAFVIGFALQGTLSNFASGLVLLGYRPFDVGDVIEAAGITGIVDSMNLISTKIRTFDNKLMIVPNNKIATDTITNATASSTRRVDLTFGIGYSDSIEKAKEILENVVKQHELVLSEPAPVIQLNELADSSVNFIVRPWAKTPDYWTVYWDILRKVKVEFGKNGISIPFPQRDVHLYREAVVSAAESKD